MPAPKEKRAGVILPHKPFLYTVDQVALLIGENPMSFADKYVFREGFDIGMRTPRQLRATNIGPEYHSDFVWRINEDELKRWLRFVGVGYRDDPI